MNIPKNYVKKMKSRNLPHFLLGMIPRIKNYLLAYACRKVAILRGASIGKDTVITWKLAWKANRNLTIGDDCAIAADYLDLRDKITIGNHVIINKGVEIIRLSHIIDNDNYFTTVFYPELVIEDYCWLATGTKVLPQVTRIAKGSVCGAYSVIVKNTEEMGVYGGNPAKLLKNHNSLFDNIPICSLQGCDLRYYLVARYKK